MAIVFALYGALGGGSLCFGASKGGAALIGFGFEGLEFGHGRIDSGGKFSFALRLGVGIIRRKLRYGGSGAVGASSGVVALDGFARGFLDEARDVAFETGGRFLRRVAFRFETRKLELDDAELASGFGLGGAQWFDGGASFEFYRAGFCVDRDGFLFVGLCGFERSTGLRCFNDGSAPAGGAQ